MSAEEEEEDSREQQMKQRHRGDQRTPLIVIHRYTKSAFLHVLHPGSDKGLLNCCGVNNKVFGELLSLFEPVIDSTRYYLVTNDNKICACSMTNKMSVKGKRGKQMQHVALDLYLIGIEQRGLFQDEGRKWPLDLHCGLIFTNGG